MACQETNDVQIRIQEESNADLKESTNATDDSERDGEQMSTVPFVPRHLYHFARRALEIADYYGEKLAYFFGITSPKYEAEIREYERKLSVKKSREETVLTEYAGWAESSGESNHDFQVNTQNQSSIVFTAGPDALPKF